MASAFLAIAFLALPCSAIPTHREARLRGHSLHPRIRLALLATKGNISTEQDVDGADSAQAAVEEAERLAAREEAMLSSSDNSTSATTSGEDVLSSSDKSTSVTASGGDMRSSSDNSTGAATSGGDMPATRQELSAFSPSDNLTGAAASGRDTPATKHERAVLPSSGNSTGAATTGGSAPATKQGMAKRSFPFVAGQANSTPEAVASPRLQITIMSARGLKGSLAGGVTSLGLTDPYVTCEVLQKAHLRFQTLALDGINGPQWDHAGALTGFGAADSLHFSVFDRDAVERERLLGSVDLPIWRIGKAGFHGELPLPGAGRDGDAAFLKLAIERGGSGWDAAAWEHTAEEARDAAREAQEDAEATEDAADAEEDDQDDDEDDAKTPPPSPGKPGAAA